MTDGEFQCIVARMRPFLDELQDGPAFTHQNLQRLPPKGVYVFYENGKPMYVGRNGGSSKQTMRERIGQHTRDGSRFNQATFALQLLQEELGVPTGHRGLLTKEQLANRYKSEFIEQKRRVRSMEVRAVEIAASEVQALFEIYASLVLETTRYNSLDTH